MSYPSRAEGLVNRINAHMQRENSQAQILELKRTIQSKQSPLSKSKQSFPSNDYNLPDEIKSSKSRVEEK